MKPISARASYDKRVVERLFSPERAKDTANKILEARSASTGRFVSYGLTLSTEKVIRSPKSGEFKLIKAR